jgi:hypothetical protein
MKLKAFFTGILFLFIGSLASQTAPFSVYLEPLDIDEVGGLQSYAVGQQDGKWLIIGGRLDGLHRRQPWATFDLAGHNNQLRVVDPVAGRHWSAPLTSLPQPLQEQLSSTNMEFYQEGNDLFIVGGYGYSAAADDHLTFNLWTRVQVGEVIDAIIKEQPFASYFNYQTDDRFAVCGGQLEKMEDVYYLVGGHRFDGLYNPINNPSFTQTYTEQIRTFAVEFNKEGFRVSHLKTMTDSEQLHRRDFNVAPQIMPDGSEGITAFSGVFQKEEDLPFENCVNITSEGYQVNYEFAQFYNHYHCAHLPIYSADNNEMHTLFFGGIARYYEEDGDLYQDDNVPFVKTIARVSRDAEGQMAEYKLPVEMPDLLGASAEFITHPDLPVYPNGVVKLDELKQDKVLAGYIYGGIQSSAPNIFWENDGTQSIATTSIYKVYLFPNTTETHALNSFSVNTFRMQVFPDPSDGTVAVQFKLKEPTKAHFEIQDALGQIIREEELSFRVQSGENTFNFEVPHFEKGGVYLMTLRLPERNITRKVEVEF